MLVRKERRKCTIVGEKEMGVKLDNGSYTGGPSQFETDQTLMISLCSGVLGLLQRKQADLYLKGRLLVPFLMFTEFS